MEFWEKNTSAKYSVTRRRGQNAAIRADALAARLLLRAEIRKRAYEIFRQRNGVPGNDVEDWLNAETEVCAKHGIAAIHVSRATVDKKRKEIPLRPR
jgi:hypothetical protein